MGIPNLAVTAHTTLGAKLVLSSAFFQASAAELIGAEGAKLQKLIAAVSEGVIAITALTTVNREIKETVGALSSLEGKILQKIAAGTHLYNTTGAW